MPVSGTGDDLDRLATTLNRMLDRIDVLVDSLRQVSSDVAHDLRTPLSRLFQRLEGARTHASSVGDYERAVDDAMLEAQGLLDTFSALLRIAQVEGASPRAGFGEVNLSAVVEAVTDAYRPDAEDAGHSLITDIQGGITISGDQELLTQALANLVENALRHTPAGTLIKIRLLGSPTGQACITVEDNGPGIARRTFVKNGHRLPPPDGVVRPDGWSVSEAAFNAWCEGLETETLYPAAGDCVLFFSHIPHQGAKEDPTVERSNVVCHYQGNPFFEGIAHVSQTRPFAGSFPLAPHQAEPWSRSHSPGYL